MLRVYPIRTTKKFWNENRGRFRKNHPNALAYNDYLDRMRHEAQNKFLELKTNDGRKISSDELKNILAGKIRKTDFFAYAQKHIDRLFDRDQYNTWKKYRSVVKKISEFVEGKTLHFEEITPDFLDTLETWLQTERNNNKNTIYKDMSVFRRFIRQAVKDKIVPLEENPFLQYSLSKQKVSKEKLTIEEIISIEKADLSPHSGVWHARNSFLFSFYCAGIRFGDLACLKWNNIVDGRLIYTMSKTGKQKSIKLLPQAEKILQLYRTEKNSSDDYIFPFLHSGIEYKSDRVLKQKISSCNALVNKNLKKLMEITGVKTNISFHIARHSFADYARRKGMDLYAISKALGHQSLSITEKYLKSFDKETLDSAMDKLFSNK